MYAYKQLEDENPLFSFKTSLGVQYVLELTKDNFGCAYFNNLYSLSFYPTNTSSNKIKIDVKIQATISTIILDFLNNNKEALIHYICDSSDNRQYGRNRLFNAWFNQSNTSNAYSKLNINYQTPDIIYTLEFIFFSDSYTNTAIETNVVKQMDAFSEYK